MIKLLKANFYKLFKEKFFYILLAISVATALLSIFIYILMENATAFVVGVDNGVMEALKMYAQDLFLSGAQLGQNVGILIALGTALYIGKEFSQNTIRNKVSIGHSKTQVYLANLIMSVVITLVLYIAYQIPVFCIGIPAFGWSANGFAVGQFFRQLVCSLCIIIAFSATATIVCMLLKSLVAGIITNIVGLVLAVLLLSGLMIIPFNDSVKDIIDVVIKSTFLGQSILIGTDTVGFMVWCIVSGVIVTIGTAVLGCVFFERSDLK